MYIYEFFLKMFYTKKLIKIEIYILDLVIKVYHSQNIRANGIYLLIY